MFVDVHWSQVTIEKQLVRFDVDGTLSPSFGAEGPLRIYQSPKRRSCKKDSHVNKARSNKKNHEKKQKNCRKLTINGHFENINREKKESYYDN